MKKILLIISLLFILMPAFVFAAEDDPSKSGGANAGTPVTLEDPLGIGKNDNTAQIIIGKVIKAVLGLVGSVALAMFIYGGIVIMTAAGNSTNVDKGKNILIYSALGLVIIFTSYILVTFVINTITGKTIGGTATQDVAK